jgi:hypothetical protein
MERPEVHISGVKIPYLGEYLYRVSVDGRVKDEINSKRKWTTQEFIDVQRYYTEALTGYLIGGEVLEGWTPPKNPTIRPPMFQNKRRQMKAVSDE